MTRFLFLLLAPCLLRAQNVQDTTHYTSAVSLNVGLPAYAGQTIPQLATIGVSWTSLRPNSIGLDGAIGTSPYALAFGVVAGAARLGLVLPIEVAPSTYVTPMAGGSALGVGAGNGAIAFGEYVGASVFTWLDSSVGARTTLSVHRFRGDSRNAYLGEMGVAWRF